MKMTLAEVARWTQGELEGDGAGVVTGAAGLSEAGPEDVSFLGNPKYAPHVGTTKAGCVFLPRSVKGTPLGAGRPRVYVEDPQWAFAQILGVLEKGLLQPDASGVDPKASVHPEARLGAGVAVGACAVVERQAVVGDGTVLGPQCYVGAGSRIGKHCKLYPQVTIREHCVVGDRVILHSGAVIGADGYGFSTDRKTGAHRKIPQIGAVVIGDDVEIGANVCVDRGTIGATRIGAGTKIDNLVQIAHNVQIGRNCLIVSQVGISGSTTIGNQVVLAGQAGIVGHITIGDGAVITAQSGILSDVEPKAVLFGSPARPHREAMKIQVLLGRLPELFDTVKNLKQLLPKTSDPEGTHAKR